MVGASGGIRHGGWTSLVLTVTTYIALLFLVLVPRLYSAYVEMNAVRSELSGFRTGPIDDRDGGTGTDSGT